jgi:hypothetical protein
LNAEAVLLAIVPHGDADKGQPCPKCKLSLNGIQEHDGGRMVDEGERGSAMYGSKKANVLDWRAEGLRQKE